MSNIILNFINLNKGEEKREKVLETIKSNISFRGSNLWILACAIVIASVGLNVNSASVIIGAMLISPLMGPIVGAGFALAIYDFELLKRSGKNLLIATIVSLLVATIYFYISPFKETQSELLNRTSPNFYDVLIAFFGGLVGVITLTRVEKGNPLPGVAIATALMPPLCTAGYGLAVGNYSYFLGAFYLFSINCVFICISTFLIIKYLKYEPVSNLNARYEKQLRYAITGLIIVMIVPSFYFAFTLFQEKKFNQKVDKFILNEFAMNGYTLIYKDISYKTDPAKIELAFLTKKFTPQELSSLNKKLIQYDLSNVTLKIRQDAKNLKVDFSEEKGRTGNVLSAKDILIKNLQEELNNYKVDYSETLREVAILFPELKDVSIGKQIANSTQDSITAATVFLYRTESKTDKTDFTRLQHWLNQKLKITDVKIVRQMQALSANGKY